MCLIPLFNTNKRARARGRERERERDTESYAEASGLEKGEVWSRESENMQQLKHNGTLALFLMANEDGTE